MRPYFETEPCRAVLERSYQELPSWLGQGRRLGARTLGRILLGTLRGRPFAERFRPAEFGELSMPVTPAQGRFLYQLVLIRRPQLVVEFGSSWGISTLFLGSAVRDLGAGRVIGTELVASKAARAREHARAAGLGEQIEIRVGDARETLQQLPGPVDFLFVDGWKDLYLPITRLLLPRMAPGAVLVSDDLNSFPYELEEFRHFLRDPEAGPFVSARVPMGQGLELAVRLG